MIKDQTSLSARAETANTAGRGIVSGISTVALVAALSLPSVAASGKERPNASAAAKDGFTAISLPPIPYLDTMPWLDWNAGANALKVDTLLSPSLDPSGIKLEPNQRDREIPATS